MKKTLSIIFALCLVFSMTVFSAGAEDSATVIDLSTGSYTIETAGDYTVSAYTGENTLTVKADANVTLEGVSITAGADASAISIESGNVTINVTADSTLTGGDNGAGIYVAETASLTVKGGKLTAIGNAGTDDASGAAGIGGTWANGNSGAITIDGATVVAEGYGVHGSGIGSGSGKVVGEIKIIGGANVTAQGGYYANGEGTKLQSSYGKSDPEGSAAIGGGGKTASTIANITISGSTVVANGGSKAAGIGANFWCSCGTITIEGDSNVTAQGGSSSAGIGTSRISGYNVTSNIVITGGTVNATGGAYGAGIGCGYNGNSRTDLPESTITISGGNVTAVGGEGSAGIGGGYKTDNVDIDITGGTVVATAGALVSGKTVEQGGASAAIGSGANGSGVFENCPAVEINEEAEVTVSGFYGGKNAVEGVDLKNASNISVEYNNEEDLPAFNVTVDTAIVGGTVEAVAEATMLDTVTLEVTPNAGYKLKTLTVTDEEGNEIEVNDDYEFTMPESDVTVIATFVKIYEVKTAKNDKGSVASVSPAEEGEIVTLNITPAPGYKVKTITVVAENGESVTVGGTSFKMPACNVTVTVTYEVDYSRPVWVTVKGTANAGETVTLSSNLGYGVQTVVADEKGNYSFSAVKFLTGGTFTFTVECGETTQTVVVTVTDIKDQLNATVSGSDANVSIERDIKTWSKLLAIAD